MLRRGRSKVNFMPACNDNMRILFTVYNEVTMFMVTFKMTAKIQNSAKLYEIARR